MWQQWVNAILGIWVVALAFIGISGMALMWTLVVTGVVVAILGFWGAAMSSSDTSSARKQAYQ